MTYLTDIHPPKSSVFGDYSLWPKPKRKHRRPAAWIAGGAASAGVFVHCALPLLVGA